jgi:hypothetical protein
MYNMFSLADYLKVPLSSVLEMSHIEFMGWFAYLKLKHKEQKKQDGRQRTNNTRRGR